VLPSFFFFFFSGRDGHCRSRRCDFRRSTGWCASAGAMLRPPPIAGDRRTPPPPPPFPPPSSLHQCTILYSEVTAVDRIMRRSTAACSFFVERDESCMSPFLFFFSFFFPYNNKVANAVPFWFMSPGASMRMVLAASSAIVSCPPLSDAQSVSGFSYRKRRTSQCHLFQPLAEVQTVRAQPRFFLFWAGKNRFSPLPPRGDIHTSQLGKRREGQTRIPSRWFPLSHRCECSNAPPSPRLCVESADVPPAFEQPSAPSSKCRSAASDVSCHPLRETPLWKMISSFFFLLHTPATGPGASSGPFFARPFPPFPFGSGEREFPKPSLAKKDTYSVNRAVPFHNGMMTNPPHVTRRDSASLPPGCRQSGHQASPFSSLQ